ncbi:putative membrane protein [Methanobacterium oryzae]
MLNTVVFGIILGIVVILVIKMFKYIKKDPKDLIIPVTPFIFFGSSARALVDNGIYPLIHLLVTPGIYIFTGFITIATLLVSVYVEKKTQFDYRYLMIIVGAILCVPNILNINHIDLVAFFEVIGAWAIISSIFILLRNKWSLLKSKINLSALLAHLFDASSTFIAVDFYGYGEQHVLPNALTSLAGTAFVMFPLKIAVILTALYVIDEYVEDKTIANMLKLAIFILGLAPGMRNFLSLCIGA